MPRIWCTYIVFKCIRATFSRCCCATSDTMYRVLCMVYVSVIHYLQFHFVKIHRLNVNCRDKFDEETDISKGSSWNLLQLKHKINNSNYLEQWIDDDIVCIWHLLVMASLYKTHSKCHIFSFVHLSIVFGVSGYFRTDVENIAEHKAFMRFMQNLCALP